MSSHRQYNQLSSPQFRISNTNYFLFRNQTFPLQNSFQHKQLAKLSKKMLKNGDCFYLFFSALRIYADDCSWLWLRWKLSVIQAERISKKTQLCTTKCVYRSVALSSSWKISKQKLHLIQKIQIWANCHITNINLDN